MFFDENGNVASDLHMKYMKFLRSIKAPEEELKLRQSL